MKQNIKTNAIVLAHRSKKMPSLFVEEDNVNGELQIRLKRLMALGSRRF